MQGWGLLPPLYGRIISVHTFANRNGTVKTVPYIGTTVTGG